MTTDAELDAVKKLAMGRIFRLMSRTEQPGDVAEYERCRAIIMTDAPEFIDTRPNFARDRNNGAIGD